MRDSEDAAPVRPRVPLPELSVCAWVVLLAFLTILGADLLWVVAMGDLERSALAVLHGIPFASAPQAVWHNPTVVAQVLLSLVHGVAPWALAAFHLLVVGATLAVVVAEGRRMGGGDVRTAVVVALVVVGCAAPFVVARFPDLSLVPYVVALAIMRRRHEAPGPGVWWLVPLYLVWGNLHGGVLVGLAVLGVFLVLSRGGGGPARRVALGVAAAASLVVTSAGLGTPAYYVGVLTNEAAARKSDLWAAPDLTHPLDLAMLAAAAVLLVMCRRRGLPLWEWVAAAGLVLGTVLAARNGVWLVLFLAPAAAGARVSGRTVAAADRDRPRWWTPVVLGSVVVTACAVAVVLQVRGPAAQPQGAAVVDTVRSVAAGRPVLADEPLAETLAQAGVRVWASNPIDAFPRDVQASFLDFLDSGTVPAGVPVDVVVVADDRADDVTAGGGWAVAGQGSGYTVLTRAP